MLCVAGNATTTHDETRSNLLHVVRPAAYIYGCSIADMGINVTYADPALNTCRFELKTCGGRDSALTACCVFAAAYFSF